MKTKRKPVKRGRIGRFYYVGSKRGRTLHLSHHITDGFRTLCGVMIVQWKWARGPNAVRNAKRAPMCKKCLQVAPDIIVQQVRRERRR